VEHVTGFLVLELTLERVFVHKSFEVKPSHLLLQRLSSVDELREVSACELGEQINHETGKALVPADGLELIKVYGLVDLILGFFHVLSNVVLANLVFYNLFVDLVWEHKKMWTIIANTWLNLLPGMC